MFADPVGDSVSATAGYLDTVAYGVSTVAVSSEADATYSFVSEVAASVPDSFSVPLGYDAAQYSFCLDTDPATDPGGYPFASDEPVWCEFILTGVSKGQAWRGPSSIAGLSSTIATRRSQGFPSFWTTRGRRDSSRSLRHSSTTRMRSIGPLPRA